MSKPFRGYELFPGDDYSHEPTILIEEFYDCFKLPDVQEYLNELLMHYLTSEDLPAKTGKERKNAIFICEQLWLLSQAVDRLRRAGYFDQPKINSPQTAIIKQ